MLDKRNQKLVKIDISGSCDQVTFLDLSKNYITCIEGLESLGQQLLELDISNNMLMSMSGLSNLTSLIGLYLNGNTITKIEGINGLKQLIMLCLNKNSILDMNVLALNCLDKLERLELKHNQICDIQYGMFMDNLKHLDLSNNIIAEIKNLNGLKKLEYLDMSGNMIINIGDGLNGLVYLEYLDMSGNMIIDVGNSLNGLDSLKYLNMSNNSLSTFDVSFNRLDTLFLDNNMIEKFQVSMNDVEYVSLRNNQIKFVNIPKYILCQDICLQGNAVSMIKCDNAYVKVHIGDIVISEFSCSGNEHLMMEIFGKPRDHDILIDHNTVCSMKQFGIYCFLVVDATKWLRKDIGVLTIRVTNKKHTYGKLDELIKVRLQFLKLNV